MPMDTNPRQTEQEPKTKLSSPTSMGNLQSTQSSVSSKIHETSTITKSTPSQKTTENVSLCKSSKIIQTQTIQTELDKNHQSHPQSHTRNHIQTIQLSRVTNRIHQTVTAMTTLLFEIIIYILEDTNCRFFQKRFNVKLFRNLKIMCEMTVRYTVQQYQMNTRTVWITAQKSHNNGIYTVWLTVQKSQTSIVWITNQKSHQNTVKYSVQKYQILKIRMRKESINESQRQTNQNQSVANSASSANNSDDKDINNDGN